MFVPPSSPAAPSVPATASSFWRQDVFDLVALSCILFVVLTAVAMLLYPGGVYTDPGSQGYRFFENYLSDLGQISTISGALNLPSMLFWIIALVGVALGLAAFFLAFTQFFTASPLALWLSRSAALAGAITCVSFIGIAATPKHLGYQILAEHIAFELVAFFSFLLAVVLEIAALRVLERSTPLPRRFLWVFAGFVAALLVYITVVFLGPDDTTLAGEIIQATAQKVIVIAALVTIFAQSIQARRWTSPPKE
ncbi:MAG TPA: hypothetical protein VF120_02340 [Ktedonobacterales bacterium]